MDHASIENETSPPAGDDRPMALCAAMAAALCFAPWYSIRAGAAAGDFAKAIEGVRLRTDANAFDFTEGVLAFLFALATAAFVPLARAGLVRAAPRLHALLPLATSAGATLCMLIFLGGGPRSVYTPAMEAGRTLWFYAALAAAAAATWFAWGRARRPTSVAADDR